MSESRLHEVSTLGQSIWYDNIQRRLIASGDLQRLIDEDAIVGVTSNPTIFEKAIDGSIDYDDQVKELVSQGITDPKQIFDALSIHDIQAAADIFRPVYDRTNGVDGYISIEVAPTMPTTPAPPSARRGDCTNWWIAPISWSRYQRPPRACPPSKR